MSVGAVENNQGSEQPSEVRTSPICVLIYFARGCYALFFSGCWRIVGLLYDSVPEAPQIREVTSSY